MLTLMYGHTGIMELLQDKIHHHEEDGGKIQLKDVSETNTVLNTMMNTSISEDNNGVFGRSFSTDHYLSKQLNSDLELGDSKML